MDSLEQLYADVESEMAALALDEVRAEAAELRRGDEATVILARRFMAARGKRIAIDTRVGETVWLTVVDCSEQWLLGRSDNGEILLRLGAVAAVRGLAPIGVGEFSGPVAQRLSFAAALRALADRHACVDVVVAGRRYCGTVSKVGKDFLDLVGDGGWVCLALAAVERIEARGLS